MGPGGTQDHRGPHKTPPDPKKSNISKIIFLIAGPIFIF